MGLLAKIFGNGSGTENERQKNRSSRICRIEELESRDLLNGVGLYEPPDPINVGIVYHEDYHVPDHRVEDGETFVVGWNGGLDGTTLDQIVIDLTKNTAKYPYSANIYFNTEFEFNWELSQNAENGISVTSWNFSQDGRTLTINFNGFTAGKQFFFNIDVDEVTGEVDHPIDKLVTGKEMEGATITGKFHVENDNYEKDLPFEIGMVDKYDSAAAEAAGVPEDNYEAVLGNGSSDMPNTAGAVTDIDALRQKALKGSLSGFVYDDTNNNGIKEDSENGIGGANLSLLVWDEGLGKYVDTGKTATTDEHGYYNFTELDAFKTYMISETQPSGYEDGSESVGTIENMPADWEYGELPAIDDDTIGKIVMPANGHGINYNFGEYKNGTISGFVKDDGDNPIANVEIELYDETGTKIDETKTDNDGYYEFVNLKPGTYIVKEKQPEDFCDGSDIIGTINGVTVGELPENDVISEIVIKSGDEGIHYDFYENRKGSISGFVYDDLDNNGIKEDGENGIGGIELSLWVWDKEQGKYVDTGRTATTDGDGYYIFDALCVLDTYQVREVQPVGYEDGKETIGSLGGEQIANGNVDIVSGIVMVVNGHGENYNFGEYKNGKISGSVKDDEGKPIPGTVIELWEDGEKIGETKTDDDGNYSFDKLPPGNYTIKEQQPKKYCDGDDYVGTLGGDNTVNDVISEIVVKSGDDGTDYDFYENRKGFISGYVYIDANENGVKDTRELGIKGAVLTLWVWDEKLGEYVDTGKTAMTDGSGFYKFDDLCPFDKYQIRETQPKGFLDGEETIGTINGKESGTQTKNDIIGEIEMPPGGQGENYNFGELQPPSVPPPPPETPFSPPPYYVPPRPVGAIGQPGAAAGPNWQLPQIGEQLRSGYGGGGVVPPAQSWHLSVINAGYPRSNGSTDGIAVNEHASRTTMILSDTNGSNTVDGVRYVSVAWTPMPMNQSAWYVRDRNGKIRKRFAFGPEGGIPLVGDFNGDGIANLAVFHNGNWYIDINGNGQWDEEDLWSELGSASDQPVVGDWDGDGKTDIGIFGPEWSGDQKIIANEPGLPTDLNTTVSSRPKNVPPDITISTTMNNVRAMKHSETGGVRLDVVDHVFQYGNEGDRAFTGDFSGDGVTKIGIYRDGKWYIDRNGNGKWDEGDIFVDNTDFGLGAEGIPVVGDFNGDGIDNIGLFVDGVWHLDTTGDFKFDTRVEFGQVGDYPVVGDFEGDGIAQLAVYRAGREDSLQAGNFPEAAPAEGQGIFARQYTGDESGADGADQESLQHRGRSLHTPHTNAPLQRSR